MGPTMDDPGARRDNAGFIYVPVDIKPGCRGPACPAFAFCQGRCAAQERNGARVLDAVDAAR